MEQHILTQQPIQVMDQVVTQLLMMQTLVIFNLIYGWLVHDPMETITRLLMLLEVLHKDLKLMKMKQRQLMEQL